MKIYAWFYPEMERLSEEEYVGEVLGKLARLQADGLYFMVGEGAALAQPEPARQFQERCQEAGLDCQLGLLPFSEPPDPTPEMRRRRYAYLEDGQLQHHGLCPAWPENRLLAVQRARQLLEALEPPALHLDYMRYYFANSRAFGEDLEWEEGRKWLDTYHRCVCPLCQTERLELLGREPTPYDDHHPAYVYKRLQRRVEHVEEVLGELRALTREREMPLSVAVRAQYFNRALVEGQDWVQWAEEGLVDTLAPMNYSTSLETVERRFAETRRLLGDRQIEVLEGLARRSSAGENAPEQFAAQVGRMEELGADGVAIFHLGVLEEEDFERRDT
jgi:hypothetical protein